MIPYLQNCSHQEEGWCLECVKEMALENEYLLFWRHNSTDFFGPGEGDCIYELNRRFKKETDHELPKGWRDEE